MTEDRKVALVTGASRGIGRAIAKTLAESGNCVVGTATSDAGAEAINDWLSPLGGAGLRLDVTQADDVAEFVTKVVDSYGPPLILVNNAGITRDNILMRMKDEEWSQVIDTNLNSVYRLSKACLRGMTKARWGRIITISSVVGSMGNAGQANYAATKAGVEGFTRALAKELGSRSITVNAVAPGFIDTDMTRLDCQSPYRKRRLTSGTHVWINVVDCQNAPGGHLWAKTTPVCESGLETMASVDKYHPKRALPPARKRGAPGHHRHHSIFYSSRGNIASKRGKRIDPALIIYQGLIVKKLSRLVLFRSSMMVQRDNDAVCSSGCMGKPDSGSATPATYFQNRSKTACLKTQLVKRFTLMIGEESRHVG
jgi:3-oxoacyl-[acyl-carrier protein] reductase